MSIRHVALAFSVAVTGCAALVNGKMQQVDIRSTPAGASVEVDGAPSGQTPLMAMLTRKDSHKVRVSLSGYAPVDLVLTRTVSGWVWGNLVFGGLIGIAIDATTGAMYRLDPQQIQAALAANHAQVTPQYDGIYVVLVSAPDLSWLELGRLQKTLNSRLGQ